MGGHRNFIKGGGFQEYLYHREGDIKYIDGKRVEFISKYGDKGHHAGLPYYSDTSDVYLKIKHNGDHAETAIVYKDRKAILEFDWGHNHKGKNGSPDFSEGTVHVHELENHDGMVVRSKKQPRYMSSKEMKEYGDIIHYADPYAKMR